MHRSSTRTSVSRSRIGGGGGVSCIARPRAPRRGQGAADRALTENSGFVTGPPALPVPIQPAAEFRPFLLFGRGGGRDGGRGGGGDGRFGGAADGQGDPPRVLVDFQNADLHLL